MTLTTEAALIDTTVLVALERGELSDLVAAITRPSLSVVTLAELKAGVAAAQGTAAMLRRMRTLDVARELTIYDIDERVADAWVVLRGHLAETGSRIGANDLWIAATAVAHRLPLLSHDADFRALDSARGLKLLRA